ncbi:MAG TPA: tetratricopeptide repeat protein, partial [Terriglobia bacterium]|nr:tetratricopeptide repeat protein [Terriglobia bacterium]
NRRRMTPKWPRRMKLQLLKSFATAILLALLVSVSAGQQAPTPYQEAVALVQRQQFKPGITLLEKILDQSPNDLKAHNLMGIALTASGKVEEANAHFQKAISLNPRFYPALKNLALNEMKLKRLDEAKAHFVQVLQFDPKDPAVHLALGEIHFSSKQFKKAALHYDQSGDLAFRDAGLVLNFAGSCLQSQQPEKAVVVLRRLPSSADAPAHFEAGLMLARLAKYEDAARQFELAKPGYSDAYAVSFNLTLAYLKNLDYPAAIRTAQESIAKGNQKTELYNLLSQAYEGSGQTLEAYEALRTAAKLDPQDENNYLDLAALCVDHANYDLAMEIVNIGVGNLPQSDRLHLQRGAVLAMKGKSAEAAADFETASKLAPQKNLPYVARGITLLQAGEAAKAIELLRQRTAASPNDYMGHYILAEALNRDGPSPGSPEEREVVLCLERSIRLKADFSGARATLGKTLLRRGEVDRAIRELEKALELDPKDESPMYQLAQAYRRKGDLNRAKDLFAKVDRSKAEERDKFMNRTLLRLVREGAKQ